MPVLPKATSVVATSRGEQIGPILPPERQPWRRDRRQMLPAPRLRARVGRHILELLQMPQHEPPPRQPVDDRAERVTILARGRNLALLPGTPAKNPVLVGVTDRP